MLKITQNGPDRVDIDLSGRIDAVNMKAALEALFAASENIQNGKMLYTIPEFAMPTLGAIGVEMTNLPRLFSLLGKYEKCAVLTDSGWLQKAAEIEGALFPGIDIRSFDLDEVTKAEEWLNDAA